VVSPSRSSRAELAKIQFNSPTGIVPASPVANDRLQLTLQGAGRADNTQEISAYYPTGDNSGYTVARLNVVTYEKLPKHLVIVPLAGTTGVPTGPEIREVLNKIYGQAVAEWSVEVAPAFDAGNWDGNGNGKVEMGNSGLLSNYTAEMRAINRAFKNNTPAYGEDTYYLFLVNQSENAATLGYMPRAKQFGYVFTQAVMRTGQNVPQVIAHELGHGAFHLKHTFEETSVAKGSSTNVMDYPSGTTLNKYQWDLVHDPVRVVGLLEDDEEGAMKIDWTLLDKKYTLLLNHVYDKNHLGSLTYMDKILTARSSNNVEKTMELDYEDDEEQEWVKQWKLRTSTSDEILEKIIGKIQSTQKGVKIPKTTLYEKGIYIGTYNYEETEYPIAIYSEKAVISNLVKVQVNEVEELDEAENKRQLKCEETLIKYMILAFYESGETAPSLIMQIEKFDFSKLENTKEKWLSFLNILNTPAEPIAEANPSAEKQDSSPNSKASFPVTGEQLKLIFPPTSQERLNAVAAVINKYSNDFEITTPLRMAHFLGQIGAETGGLKKLNEDDCYREKGIKTTFGKKKYCDLFEGYEATTQTECPNKKLPGCEPELEDPFELDKLTVKKKYICSSSLFDYVYACRMDNGAPSTKDGSTYKGKGFIHLTGKDQYTAISVEWNKLYPNDKKEFHKNDINLLVEDLDVAMKASLIYWKTKKFNKIADNGIDEDNIDKIGKKVNGSGSNLPNGYKERRSYAKLAYTVISPK
jgi:predicted chitinase